MSKVNKSGTSSSLFDKVTKKRPGVHAKKGTSKNKKSKNYKKQYKSQGK